jgi:hypothetical protein
MSRVHSTQSRAALCALALLLGSACRHGRTGPPRVSDLIPDLPRAERRAVGLVDEAIRVDVVGPPEDPRPALLMRAPARVTFTVRLPGHAHLMTAVWLLTGQSGPGVTVRVGLSDLRHYDELLSLHVAASPGAWQPVDVDLSAYGGWQWSLFYRPSTIDWRLILNADPAPAGAVAWAQPLVRER